jgi:type II secretory pathway predicted ATPase ExeA
MLPEYLKYWGLNKAPFSLTPDPDMLYLSKQHQEGLIRLKYAVISNKGGALLVSENAGDGKTSLLTKLTRDLEEQYMGGCRVVFIDHPTLTANQMVIEISRQLGVGTTTTDKLTLLNELRRFLMECHEQKLKCVVILDEGQMLCHRPDLLQELRILLNFCVADAFLLTFILSGQRPLDETLRGMPEFYQRLPVRFFLKNLDRNDTREMIRHRLHLAGNPESREIFSEDGYTGIFNYSKGCPRIICSVADLALVIAHSRYSEQVDFVAVSQACSDMNRTDGSYHYFYFLKSFSEEAGSQEQVDASTLEAPQSGRLCLNCGTRNPNEVKFCPECGESFAVEHDTATVEKNVPVAPNAVSEEVEENKAEKVQAKHPKPVKKKRKPRKAAKSAEKARDIQLELDPPTTERKEVGIDTTREGLSEGAEQVSTIFTMDDKGSVEPDVTGEDRPAEHIGDSAPFKDSEVPLDMKKCTFCGLLLEKEIEQCTNCGEPLRKVKSGEGEALTDHTKEEQPVEKAENGAGIVDESDFIKERGELREDTEVGSSAIEQVETSDVICPHCGEPSGGANPLCCNCGSSVFSDSYEQILLKRLEELSFGKYILSKSYLRQEGRLDPRTEELLFIPLNRLWSSNAVLRYTNEDSGESFTTCCGLIFTSGKIKFVFTGEVKELPYEDIETISVDKLSKNNSVIVYQLVLSSIAGIYRISLPYNSSQACQMSELLEQYLAAKIEGVAHVVACRKNQL